VALLFYSYSTNCLFFIAALLATLGMDRRKSVLEKKISLLSIDRSAPFGGCAEK
jgi:hypothetical protein